MTKIEAWADSILVEDPDTTCKGSRHHMSAAEQQSMAETEIAWRDTVLAFPRPYVNMLARLVHIGKEV